MNEKSPVVSLIQARLSSSRLPGKVLLPLGDITVLDQVVVRAAAFSRAVVVCTSIDASDDPIETHCRKRGVICVRGPLDDVFSRFRVALADPRVPDSAWFARITSDCPLISVSLARHLIDRAVGSDLDYVCIELDQAPRGIPVELVRRESFEGIDVSTLDAPEREHVTLVLYEKPGRFRCARISVPEPLRYPEFRLTLDYAEDYTLFQRLFEAGATTTEAAIQLLREQPALREINAHCIQKAAR